MTGRNVTLSASTTQVPDYTHGPHRALLDTPEMKDAQGHLQAGAWVAGTHDNKQYIQVG